MPERAPTTVKSRGFLADTAPVWAFPFAEWQGEPGGSGGPDVVGKLSVRRTSNASWRCGTGPVRSAARLSTWNGAVPVVRAPTNTHSLGVLTWLSTFRGSVQVHFLEKGIHACTHHIFSIPIYSPTSSSYLLPARASSHHRNFSTQQPHHRFHHVSTSFPLITHSSTSVHIATAYIAFLMCASVKNWQ